MSEPQHTPVTGISRRGMLAAGGAAIIGAAGGYALGTRRGEPAASPAPVPSASPTAELTAASATAATAATMVPFHGPHQAGIVTPPALLQAFIGLDLLRASRDDAAACMRLVTDDAARLMAGQPALGDAQPDLASAADQLTITVGLGHSLFRRLGLGDQTPASFAVLPEFSTDRLEKPWSGTDLLLQVGANDPVTLAHTIRMLLKDVSTLAATRWIQSGFRSPTPANPGSAASRNLMGQVDGTINPTGDSELDVAVWIDQGPEWARGGTVLVLRRIRMLLDTWDILDRDVQESVIGRRLDTGAALGATTESDPVPFDAVDGLGLPVIAADAHIRVAHAATTEEMILRRPYNYDDGPSDAGLLFAAYSSDPRRSFIPMQERIAASDAFNRWNTTVGSATYLIPSGVTEGRILAEGLLA